MSALSPESVIDGTEPAAPCSPPVSGFSLFPSVTQGDKDHPYQQDTNPRFFICYFSLNQVQVFWGAKMRLCP